MSRLHDVSEFLPHRGPTERSKSTAGRKFLKPRPICYYSIPHCNGLQMAHRHWTEDWNRHRSGGASLAMGWHQALGLEQHRKTPWIFNDAGVWGGPGLWRSPEASRGAR
jgi:hypothetical protein